MKLFKNIKLYYKSIPDLATKRASTQLSVTNEHFPNIKQVSFDSPPQNICIFEMKQHQESMKYLSQILLPDLESKNIILPQNFTSIDAAVLSKHNCEVYNFNVFNEDDINDAKDKIDLVYLFGGDGTLLYFNHIFDDFQAPIIGVRGLGSLGFLLPFELYEKSFDYNELHILERMRLDIQVTRAGELYNEKRCVNEISILRRYENPISIESYINECLFSDIRGDGVLVSTSTGSTGYNLSCRSSPVHPLLNAFMVTPINTSSLGLVPFILNDNCFIKLVVKSDDCVLSFDSLHDISENLKIGDEIVIKRADVKLKTVLNQKCSITDEWIKKLKNRLVH